MGFISKHGYITTCSIHVLEERQRGLRKVCTGIRLHSIAQCDLRTVILGPRFVA